MPKYSPGPEDGGESATEEAAALMLKKLARRETLQARLEELREADRRERFPLTSIVSAVVAWVGAIGLALAWSESFAFSWTIGFWLLLAISGYTQWLLGVVDARGRRNERAWIEMLLDLKGEVA